MYPIFNRDHTKEDVKTHVNVEYESKITPNVRLIDCKVLSWIYPVMNSSFFFSVMAVFDKG